MAKYKFKFKFKFNDFCESKNCKYLKKWKLGTEFNGYAYNCKLKNSNAWDIFKLAKNCIHEEEAQKYKMWEQLKHV